MAALSFGDLGAFTPTAGGFSLGTSVLQPTAMPKKTYSGRGSYGMPKPKVYSGRGSYGMPKPKVYSGRGSYGMPQAKVPLSFGTAVPSSSVGTRTPLTFGGSVPKSRNTGFINSAGGGLSNFLKTLSMGTAVAPTSPVRKSSAGIPSVPQIDTVTIAGGSDAADAAKNLASSIFGNMLQPASFGGGSTVEPAMSGGGSGGFMDRIGTTEIVLGAAALGVVFMLVSGGGTKRRRRR